MTEQEFDKVIEDTLESLKQTLLVKGKEYRRNNNPFHNFDTGSLMTGLLREKILDGFMLKHEISVKDMVDDIAQGILPSEEVVEEKFGDILIYTLIKKASILDRINKQK
jgi:hypothetical protein